MNRLWPALVLRTTSPQALFDELIPATLDEFSPVAIEDCTPLPLPPGGLWDPTFPPPPEPPPAPLHWRVVFSSGDARDRAAHAIADAYPGVIVERVDLADEDWASRSQRDLKSISAGAFTIAPPWGIPRELPSGQSLIVIEPSRGFGTGHHASTRLCLRALSQIDVHGATVLDLGTGSGVLALAARLRGAREVTAVDVDPDAIECARESAALNPSIAAIDWRVADFRHAAERRDRTWDVVLANLTGGMLISSAEAIRALLAPSGRLILSGFDERERQAVEQALEMTVDAAFVEEGWVGLVGRVESVESI